MNTNVTPMACGNCSNGLFKMFQRPGTAGFVLLAECSKCMSITIIEPTPAELQLSWGDGSAGRLCKMEPNAKASLTESMLTGARVQVARHALAQLEIPNYTVLKQGEEWLGESSEAALRLPLEISATGTPRGPAVDVTFVVRFNGAKSAEFLEAYVLLGDTTVLASLSQVDYRPNPAHG